MSVGDGRIVSLNTHVTSAQWRRRIMLREDSDILFSAATGHWNAVTVSTARGPSSTRYACWKVPCTQKCALDALDFRLHFRNAVIGLSSR